ncbi:hypothetical protein JCGZ_07967 [Jatropha curcas]|uniref:SHSP domain-containing protein n=1 Tax=Jatropha curcas TaxID=180498 RepID=A0A067LPV5_JATCU|nr:18.5 kDa class I heat shock protein [Jatropha curcas]KDP46950.1 hypothetical protein JCGZ_07967 [Jatropha curcas]
MSIVPVSDQRGTIANRTSPDFWDLEGFSPLLDPFQNFPFPSLLSAHFPSVFSSLETQVDWRETPRAHVFRGVFGGSNNEDVLVYIDDNNILQISTESGKFMSKFKLPDNAQRDKVSASMVNGVLIVTVPKEGGDRISNVRAIEISGSD